MFFVIFLLIAALNGAVSAPAEDLVREIPGLDKQPFFRTYSGYLKATGTRKLHYWFAESQSDTPTDDPLVTWFNGGPGCSSMEGMLKEHGPFMIQDDGVTLKYNPSSWNLIANMLYIEAPAGVGYSYSDDRNYTTGDKEVADANYAAIKSFFQKFPEYKSNKFFITGESYAGIYVPTLSAKVVFDNEINFSGLMIGNGLSSFEVNDNSAIYFWYYHGLIGPHTWHRLVSECCGGKEAGCNFEAGAKVFPACGLDLHGVQMQVMSEGINMYNILSPCAGGVDLNNPLLPTSSGNRYETHDLGNLFRNNYLIHKYQKHRLELTRNATVSVKLSPPCTNDTSIDNYMNSAAVRTALHIAPHLPSWELCSNVVGAEYHREYDTMLDIYKMLLSSRKKPRILVYNGDIDMACNFLGDQWFVESLARRLLVERRPWLVKDEMNYDQIAGFVKQFDGITFLTVKGAGHMVPSDKPRQAYEMFRRFVKDVPF